MIAFEPGDYNICIIDHSVVWRQIDINFKKNRL